MCVYLYFLNKTIQNTKNTHIQDYKYNKTSYFLVILKSKYQITEYEIQQNWTKTEIQINTNTIQTNKYKQIQKIQTNNNKTKKTTRNTTLKILRRTKITKHNKHNEIHQKKTQL